ncbi:MAG: hypothetical protein JSS76_20135, partial [Bacteroidetes bacterium]|nr:hypothetical protein [Bacteroidota bacterium]
MRKVLLGLTLLCSVLAWSQPGCPYVNAGSDQILPCGTSCTSISASYFNTGNTSTYSVTSIPYTPFSYTAGTAIIVGTDDIWSSTISLPFNFCYFGNTYNQVVVGANELISFNTAYAGTYCPWPLTAGTTLPTTSYPLNSIMGPYQDIDPSCGGTIKYQIIGSYPCRIFVISYYNVPMYAQGCFFPGRTQCAPLSATSQIALYETTNAIEIYIGTKQSCPNSSSGWNDGLAIEGIQDATGSLAYTVPGRNNTVWNATNDAYRFTPSGPSIVSVKWTGPGVNDSITGNSAQLYTISVCPPSSTTAPVTTTYTATATYYRCDNTTVVKTDDVNITTTPGPNGGPDQNLGCYVPGLVATMAATASTGATWTTVPGNPSATTITTPSSPTTTITGFTTAGNYYYLWGNATCKDTVEVIITTTANAGPDQTASCVALPGGSVTMAGVGSGTWTMISSPPGTATITPATSPTATISNFSAAGTYLFKWNGGACVDTAAVIVTAKPNAGADKTVSCATLPGGSTTMSATGTGTWTLLSPASSGTCTITTSTTAAAVVSNFSAAGTYYLQWANASGCYDTAVITVTQKPDAGPDQTVNCAVLPGGTATMAATGTGTWSLITPASSGTCTITPATSPTATVSAFSVAGSYYLLWTNADGCKDTAIITVTAKPDAGPDKTVNCAVLPGGSTTMSATGTGTWSVITGTCTVAPATSPTATVSNFAAAGVYSLKWTNAAGCTDTATITVTAKPNAGPDLTVSCAVLPGGSATMAATGTGTWTAVASNAASTITAPGSATTTVTGFASAGTYYYIWTNAAGCADTMTITVTAKPDAGTDKTVNCAVLPGGSAAMTAVGTGTWSLIAGLSPGTCSISPATSATATVSNFSRAGVYYLKWTNASGCTDTATVTVTARPNAGASSTLTCITLPGGSVTMSAQGVGTWTASGNPGAATIVNPTDSHTVISNFSAAGFYTFTWTNAAGCTATANVTVTEYSNAGPDQIVNCAQLPGGIATMAAVTTTGVWTPRAGNPGTATISNTTSPTTTISNFPVQGDYYYVWTNGSCRDTVKVTVTGQTTAGPAGTLTCITLPGGSVTMGGAGTGTWSQVSGPGSSNIVTPTSPTSVINGFTAPGVYTYTYANATCNATTTITVSEKADAGPDQFVSCIAVAALPGGSATMAGSGNGVWRPLTGNPGVATIADTTSPTTTISNFPASGVYKYVRVNGTCRDTVLVTVTTQPLAGPDQSFSCIVTTGFAVTMAGTGAGTWTASTNNPVPLTITNPTSTNATVRGFTVDGIYTLYLTNGTCVDSMTVTVTVKPNAGADQTVSCAALPGGSATLSANTSGTWSLIMPAPGNATILSPNFATTSITNFTAPGVYYFKWTDAAGCTDTATVTVTAKPDAGPDQTLNCYPLNNSVTMAAAGTGTWSAAGGNPGTAVITSTTNPVTTIHNFTAAGTYTYIWTNGGCKDTALVYVIRRTSAGPDQSICQYTGTALAAGGTGAGLWSQQAGDPATVIFANAADSATSVTGFGVPGVYHLIWTSGGCEDTMQVTVRAKPDA